MAARGTRTDEADALRATEPPAAGTVERWCYELVGTRELARKLAPPPLPGRAATAPEAGDEHAHEGSWEAPPVARRLARPGRPPELVLARRSARTPRPEALARPAERARLLHTFAHHELQAAELFAWAVLAFPETPREFRAGLLRLCLEELAHLRAYAAHLETLGVRYGTLAVRDWFWERVPLVADAAGFVALLGLGLEGANLEHSARFAALLRAAGDEAGARLLERVEREEVGHVAFARCWFERLTGAELTYERWCAALPRPLSPALLRGQPLNRVARARAGFDAAFLDRLAAEPSTALARPRGTAGAASLEPALQARASGAAGSAHVEPPALVLPSVLAQHSVLAQPSVLVLPSALAQPSGMAAAEPPA